MAGETLRTGLSTVTPQETTRKEIHEPRVFATDTCVEVCRQLGKITTEAMARSVKNPNSQIDVVCPKPVRFGCNADAVCSGSYGAGFGNRVDGSDELFLVNPSGYYEQPGGPASRVQHAIEQGLEPRRASDVV